MSIANHVRAGAALAALLIVITPHRAAAQFDALSKKMTDKIGSVGGEPTHAPAPAKRSHAKPAPTKPAAEHSAGELPGTQPDSGIRRDSVPHKKTTARPRRASHASLKGKGANAARPHTSERAPSPPGRTAPRRDQ
jgi:hypothetical protein